MNTVTDPRVHHEIVQAAWAHPVWSHYLVSACHLRPVEGLPDAVKCFPEATHELQILALSPDDNKTPLTPINYGIQCAFEHDDQAADLCKRVIAAISDRRLNPDTDYIQANAIMIEDMAAKCGALVARTSWKR